MLTKDNARLRTIKRHVPVFAGDVLMTTDGVRYTLDSWEFPSTLYVVKHGERNKKRMSLDVFGLETYEHTSKIT